MIEGPIICSGNDLQSTLDGLRKRGMFIASLTTGVNGNAGYRVNYFERVRGEVHEPELRRPSDNKLSSETMAGSRLTEVGSNPAALTHSDPSAVKPAQGACHAQVQPKADGPESICPSLVLGANNGSLGSTRSCVTDTPASGNSISIEDRLSALQSRLASAGRLRRSKPKTQPEHARQPHKND